MYQGLSKMFDKRKEGNSIKAAPDKGRERISALFTEREVIVRRTASQKNGQENDHVITLAEVDPGLRYGLADAAGLLTPAARRITTLPGHQNVTDPDQKLCVVRVNGKVPPATFIIKAEDVGRHYQNLSPQILPRAEACAHIRSLIPVSK